MKMYFTSVRSGKVVIDMDDQDTCYCVGDYDVVNT